MISGKDREVFTTSGTYPSSFVTQIFHNGQPNHRGDRKFSEVMTSTLPKGTLGSVASLLAATLYIKKFLIGTTSSGISYHLRDIYSICRCCWDVTTFKWKVHNGKIVYGRQRQQRQIHNIIPPHAYSRLLFTENRNMCHRSMTYATME